MTHPDPQYAAYLAWLAQQSQPAAPQSTDPQYAAYLAAQQGPQRPATNGHLPTGGAAEEPAVEVVYGEIEDYQNQKVGGGTPSWKFVHETLRHPLIGKTYEGIVDREIVGGKGGDIEAVTDNEGKVRMQRDKTTPKFMMKVPMRMVPSEKEADGTGYPDGFGTIYMQGDRQVKINAAMAEVGLPEGPPPKGTWIRLRLVRTQPVKDRLGKPLNPKFIYEATVRAPHDPWTIEQTALIDAAHSKLAAAAEAEGATPAGALTPPAPGSPPEAYIAYANALAAAQAPQVAAAPPAAPPPPPVVQPAPPVTPAPVTPPAATAPPAPQPSTAVTPPVPVLQQAASNGTPDLAAAAAAMGLDPSSLEGLDDNARAIFLQMASQRSTAPASA